MTPTRKQLAKFAFFGALVASAIQGTNTVAYKLAFDTMDPLSFTAFRSIAMGLVFLLFLKSFRHLLRGKQFVHVLIHTLLGLFTLVTLAIGVDLSTAINASIMSLSLPIFIYIFAVLFLREPALKQVMLGGVIALIGSVLIIGLPIILEQRLVLGDVVLLLSFIGLAAMIVHTKYAYRYLSTAELLAVRFLASGILVALYIVIFTDRTLIEGNSIAWWSLAYSTFLTGVLATGLYYYSLRFIKAEYAAPIFYVDPMIGVVAAALVLHEELTTSAIVGATVIVIGVIVSHAHLSEALYRLHLPSRNQKIRLFISTHWPHK